MNRLLQCLILLGCAALVCLEAADSLAQTNFAPNTNQTFAQQPTAAALPAASSQEATTIEQSLTVLKEIMDVPAKRIPVWLLKDAEGIAIIPNMVNGGLVIGARRGKGVVLIRDTKGSWHAPSFVTLTGGSIGFQAGIQSTDVVLVFKTRKSVDNLLKGKFTLGADAAAAAGPVGRQATAATDLRLQAEIYSYSRSRGLFAGVALDGSMLQIERSADAAYYGVDANGQAIAIPDAAIRLIEQVVAYTLEGDEGLAAATPLVNENQPPPGLGYAGGAPPGTVPSTAVMRAELAGSWTKLAPLLDARWQAYLALPPEVFAGNRDANPQSVLTLVSHYETVAADPKYRLLTERQAFQSTRQLLRDYAANLQTTGSNTLNLPSPPNR